MKIFYIQIVSEIFKMHCINRLLKDNFTLNHTTSTCLFKFSLFCEFKGSLDTDFLSLNNYIV